MGLDITPNDGHKKFHGEPMNFSQQLFMSSENDPDFGSGPLLFGSPLDTNGHGDFNGMPDLTCIEGENGFMPLDLGYLS